MLLTAAAMLITISLFFYSVGVWAEHIARRLKPWHLGFFWLGFVFDFVATGFMFEIAAKNRAAQAAEFMESSAPLVTQASLFSNLHGASGMVAIILMLIHAIWATFVLLSKNEKSISKFHRFSVGVWIIWLIPYITGFASGF